MHHQLIHLARAHAGASEQLLLVAGGQHRVAHGVDVFLRHRRVLPRGRLELLPLLDFLALDDRLLDQDLQLEFLFLGLPLFPGESEYNQLFRILKMRGAVPDSMIGAGSLAHKFFAPKDGAPPDDEMRKSVEGVAPSSLFRFKSEAEYCRENNTAPCRNKQYFKHTELPDLIAHHPPIKPAESEADEAEERDSPDSPAAPAAPTPSQRPSTVPGGSAAPPAAPEQPPGLAALSDELLEMFNAASDDIV